MAKAHSCYSTNIQYIHVIVKSVIIVLCKYLSKLIHNGQMQQWLLEFFIFKNVREKYTRTFFLLCSLRHSGRLFFIKTSSKPDNIEVSCRPQNIVIGSSLYRVNGRCHDPDIEQCKRIRRHCVRFCFEQSRRHSEKERNLKHR